MRKLLNAKHWGADDSWMEKQGDECWDTICDTFSLDVPFTTDDAALAWQKQMPGSLMQRRREVHLVLKNVLEEWKTISDEKPHLIKKGQSIWMLPSLQRKAA